MATVVRVTRVANPRRRRAKVTRSRRKVNARRTTRRTSHRRRNTRHRRVLTPKQIRFFGTSKQKAALRASRKRKAARHRARPIRRRTANPRRRRRVTRRNPALVVTLGAVNPRRRKSTMARRRKARKSNPHRRRAVVRRRRRNATRTVVMAPRRRRINRRRYSRRRNPAQVFGTPIMGRGGLTVIAGGLLGVAAAKFIPTLIPATLQMGGSTIARVAITGAAAWAASLLAGKIPGVGTHFADAVFFGGLMQTGSVALNAILPGFRIGGVPVALSGMGELMPGQFSVPQNPLRLPAAPAQARVQMNGLQRVWGTAL